MHLKRIKVNNFRALKNIEIEFEREFPRRIFPLGSLNGGGKSTLLQLTFILLHCSASQDPDQLQFIKNLLSGFRVKASDALEEIVSFEIIHNNKEYCIRFYACKDSYIQKILHTDHDQSSNSSSISFSSMIDLKKHENKLESLKSEVQLIKKSIRQIEILESIDDSNLRRMRIDDELKDLRSKGIKFSRIIEHKFLRGINISPTKIQEELQELLDIATINLSTAQYEHEKLSNDFEIINRYLEERYLNYVTTYYQDDSINESLFYKVDSLSQQDALDLLEAISRKIFLAAPLTNIYLFLSKRDKISIFKSKNFKDSNYFQALEDAKIKIGTFLNTYDFFETEFLISLFVQARDQDFQYAIENKGEYGTNNQNLLTEINSILPGKSINVIAADLSQVTFRMTIDSEERNLLPEDLSHGELKKLNIYTWIKTCNMKGAIVLMDEPEIALHPDWQYDLTNNLWDWEPSNQYILATHSYEICQALTFHHIKEIEPKLLKPDILRNNDD